MIFLRINLPNFVQPTSIKAYRDHGVPRVIVFNANFFFIFTAVNINSLNTNTVTKR